MDIETLWRNLDAVAIELYRDEPQALVSALAMNRQLMATYEARAIERTSLKAVAVSAAPATAGKAQPQDNHS